MTLAARLARLEATTTPRDAVLAWLAEAQQFPTLPDYLAALRDAPREAWPLVRLAGQVETAVRARVKGTPQQVWGAVRRAVGDACFLVELVLQCNRAAHEVRDSAGLRWALLTKWSGLLSAEAELARLTRRADAEHAAREAQDWRDALALALTTLYAEEVARASLERRYFAGQGVLFPGLAQAWAELLERLEWLAEHAEQLHGPAGPDGATLDPAELRARAAEGAAQRASELADLARIAALELLGERERALAVLERRIEALLRPIAAVPDRDGSA
jgi:hypothetical protein